MVQCLHCAFLLNLSSQRAFKACLIHLLTGRDEQRCVHLVYFWCFCVCWCVTTSRTCFNMFASCTRKASDMSCRASELFSLATKGRRYMSQVILRFLLSINSIWIESMTAAPLACCLGGWGPGEAAAVSTNVLFAAVSCSQRSSRGLRNVRMSWQQGVPVHGTEHREGILF